MLHIISVRLLVTKLYGDLPIPQFTIRFKTHILYDFVPFKI